MVMFKLIRLVDFLGCDTFLENTAKQLGTSVHKINNSNSIKTVYLDLPLNHLIQYKTSWLATEGITYIADMTALLI